MPKRNLCFWFSNHDPPLSITPPPLKIWHAPLVTLQCHWGKRELTQHFAPYILSLEQNWRQNLSLISECQQKKQSFFLDTLCLERIASRCTRVLCGLQFLRFCARNSKQMFSVQSRVGVKPKWSFTIQRSSSSAIPYFLLITLLEISHSFTPVLVLWKVSFQ